MVGYEHIPETGGAIVATNHLGRLDGMLGVLLTDRHDFILMIAEKYQRNWFWNWAGKKVNAIWLNRYEADFLAMREVYRRLKQGQILGIAPEGTRSASETMAEGKPGAAYLAAKTGLPIIPVGVYGTEDRIVKQELTRLKRLDIHIRIGEPFYLAPMDRKHREEYLQQSTEEIMCQIAALLPVKYRGFYADYPRVQELIAEHADTIETA